MQVLQGKSTFNLKKSIKIEIYWNTKLELTLMQKRVTKDTIIRQNEDEPIKLKNCLYILISYRDNNLRSVKLLKQRDEPVIDPINPEMVFNTIEYFNNDRYKYGSPIIYTGMTN